MLSLHTHRRPSDQRRTGLTLIELVMVLVILVALAGLLVPQVDFLRRSSDKGTASVTMKNVSENVQLFRTLKGVYPNNWDSLIEDGGSTIYAKLPDQGKYITSTLQGQEAASLTKIGITSLLDHDDSSAYRGIPGNSGSVARGVATGETVVVVANADIAESIYPGRPFDSSSGIVTLNNGLTAKLVVVGLGPLNESVGQTMMAPPTYAGVDNLAEYNRYLAVFAVFDNNALDKRALLKSVLDSKGDFLNQEIAEFNENQLE